MTRIALVGYGAMGHELERLAPDYGCEVVRVFDDASPVRPTSPADFDVAIDFSQPDAVIPTVQALCALKRNVVVGTTGWLDERTIIEQCCHDNGIGLVYGSNFSVGVQIFYHLVREASFYAERETNYDVMVHEWHHKRKKDSPSGTALKAASIVIDEVTRKNHIAIDAQTSPIDPKALHVTSTRGGEIVGTHQVTLDSLFDSIEITHRAKNRSGFAIGALLAARWVVDKRGVFDFTAMFTDIMSKAHE